MGVQDYYTKMLRREKERMIKSLSVTLKSEGLKLVDLKITDDGYAIDVTTLSPALLISVRELCKKVDRLRFPKYMVVDTVFSAQVVSLMLVPTTGESMNDFIWNYIMVYLPHLNGIDALVLSVGALEHMVEPLGPEIKAEYNKLINCMIQ